MAQPARTDVTQLGQEVTFILQEAHKRFADLNPTECLYVASFLIHQLPEQADLLGQQRQSLTTPRSATRYQGVPSKSSGEDENSTAVRSGPSNRASTCGDGHALTQRPPARGEGANATRAAVAATSPDDDTLASTATASDLATPASEDLNDDDDFPGCDNDVADAVMTLSTPCVPNRPREERRGEQRTSATGRVAPHAQDSDSASLSLNLSSLVLRRGSREGEMDSLRPRSLTLWQQSAITILQDAARAFRRYEEEEESGVDSAGALSPAGLCRSRTETSPSRPPNCTVRASLQRALEAAADRWVHGAGSQWQSPRVGVATVAASAVTNTPRVTAATTASYPAHTGPQPRPPTRAERQATTDESNAEDDELANKTLLVMRAVEQQARALCRQAYEDLYDRHVTEVRAEVPAAERSVHAPPAPPCSIVVECDAPVNDEPASEDPPHSSAGVPSGDRGETETQLLAFVVGCDALQLEYLQGTVLACPCDPYPGSELTDKGSDDMSSAERDALATAQRAWRQRHCLVRILEPLADTEAGVTCKPDDTDSPTTETRESRYSLSEGFFALRSLLGLALEVWGESDPHLVALVDDPERSQNPSHVVPSSLFWAAWPDSVPLRPRRGEQRASLRSGVHLPLPMLPGEVFIVESDLSDVCGTDTGDSGE